MNKVKKNVAASIRQKLKNIAKQKKKNVAEILRYYSIERFLYRLSMSKHRKNFFLKGGLMLKILNPTDHRATMDIDLLSRSIINLENIRKIICEISAIPVEDGIFFDATNLNIKEIQAFGNYGGIRAKFLGYLAETRIPMQLDIGFDDIVSPSPIKITYPTLLEMKSPVLVGYAPENLIAEKIEAITKLGLDNTRMKDFYDIWKILKTFPVDKKKLEKSIRTVFRHRKTSVKNYPIAFTKEYYESKEIKIMWKSFMQSMGNEVIDFVEIIKEIRPTINPIFSSMLES